MSNTEAIIDLKKESDIETIDKWIYSDGLLGDYSESKQGTSNIGILEKNGNARFVSPCNTIEMYIDGYGWLSTTTKLDKEEFIFLRTCVSKFRIKLTLPKGADKTLEEKDQEYTEDTIKEEFFKAILPKIQEAIKNNRTHFMLPQGSTVSNSLREYLKSKGIQSTYENYNGQWKLFL